MSSIMKSLEGIINGLNFWAIRFVGFYQQSTYSDTFHFIMRVIWLYSGNQLYLLSQQLQIVWQVIESKMLKVQLVLMYGF